jgi:hypothetical protein
VGDALGLGTCLFQVVRDRRGHTLLASMPYIEQSAGCALMQPCAPGSRNAIIQIADQQGMPEMVGDPRAGALIGQYACFQSLLQQVEHAVLDI